MAFPMETKRGPGDAGPIRQVFLGEVHSGVSGTQVVVKELKASASVQEQMQFLEEAQPYRWVGVGDQHGGSTGRSWEGEGCAGAWLFPFLPSNSDVWGSSRALQHGNLLQCLAQCAEVTPYLLVMEFCPLVSGSPWETAVLKGSGRPF